MNFLNNSSTEKKIKHLFISDLDGTLLNQNAQISQESVAILNEQIEMGTNFTIATARTPLSALPIVEPLHMNCPMVLMNGALIYSANEHAFLYTVGFGEDSMQALAEAEKQVGIQGMLFWIENGKFCMQLGEVKKCMWDGYFHLDKVEGIDVICTDIHYGSAQNLYNQNVVYALYMDNTPEKLEMMCTHLQGKGLVLDFYKDLYTEDRWCLEISSSAASKGDAVKRLKEMLKVDYLIGFGDSWNDVPLFQCCDAGYAVENASEELKKHASGIIKSNVENGVALFIKEWNEKGGQSWLR